MTLTIPSQTMPNTPKTCTRRHPHYSNWPLLRRLRVRSDYMKMLRWRRWMLSYWKDSIRRVRGRWGWNMLKGVMLLSVLKGTICGGCGEFRKCRKDRLWYFVVSASAIWKMRVCSGSAGMTVRRCFARNVLLRKLTTCRRGTTTIRRWKSSEQVSFSRQ